MIKKVAIGIISIIMVLVIVVIAINVYVVESTKNAILTREEAKKQEKVDCILVLGAGVWRNRTKPYARR